VDALRRRSRTGETGRNAALSGAVSAGAPARRDLAPWLLAVLAFAFAAKLGVALWALPRGFELGDEGLSLLNLNHPAGAPPAFEIYRLLLLVPGLRFGVVEARLLRLAAELLGTLALVAGVFAWARANFFAAGSVRFRDLLLVALLGTLLSVASRSLTYNDLTNLFTFGAIGCLFYVAARTDLAQGRRARAVAAALAGVCTGLQLLAKFPPALLLLAGTGFVLLLGFRAWPLRERVLLLAWNAAGVMTTGLIYVFAVGGVEPVIATIRLAAAIRPLVGYDPIEMLRRYVQLERWTLIHGATFAATLAALLWVGKRRSDRAVAAAFAIAAIVLAIRIRAIHPTFLHPSLVYLACFATVVPVALLWLALRARAAAGESGSALAPLGILMLVPLVEIMGTNVPLTMRLPSHVAPLFAAIAVLALDLRVRAGYRLVFGVLVAVLVALGGVVFTQHHWLRPYGLPAPLSEQRHEVVGLPGVRVDLATKTFLEDVGTSLREAGYRPGAPIVALDFMPGLMFYLQGSSPGSAFYMFDKPLFNCFNLNRAPLATSPFLILAQPMAAEQRDCIAAFRFPDQFRALRALRNPYEDVYASFGAPGFSHVQLFAPK